MSPWIVILLTAASSVLFHIASSAEECSASEYSGDVLNYLNQIGRSVRDASNRVKVEKGKFIKELNDNIAKSFQKAGCPDLWKTEYAEPLPWLHTLMKSKDQPPPKPVIDLIEHTEKAFWIFAEDHVLATCFQSVTRSYEIGFLRDCAGDGILPVDETVLNDVITPDFSSDKDYMDLTRGAVNLIGWGLVRAADCGIGTDIIIASMNTVAKAAEKEICYSGSDSFISDKCYEKFQSNCPKIMKCMDDLAKNLQKDITKLYIKEGDRFKVCIKRSSAHWKQIGRPKSLDTPAIMFAKALKHFTAISKIDFTKEETKASIPYVRAWLLSVFHAHSCNCEVPNPPGDSKDEE